MFKIQVADDDVSGGSIPITWCLDLELINKLAEHKKTDPQVVLIVSPAEYDEYKEQRYVIPLNDLIAYVGFYIPGKVNIFAFVSFKSKTTTKDEVLGKYCGKYSTRLLKSDGLSFDNYVQELFSYSYDNAQSESIQVDVPETCFAKQPPQWEQNWVNWLFGHKVKDQCDYRKRRIFAYTAQIPIMIGSIIIRMFMFLLALLIGSRGLTLKYLLHPIENDFSSSNRNLFDGSIFISKLPEDNIHISGWKNNFKYIFKKLWKLPLMPPITFLIGELAYHHKLFIVLGFSTLVIISGTIIVFILATIVEKEFRDEVFDFLFCWLDKKESALWFENKEEIDLLSCDHGKNTFKTLPNKKKSIKLRFQETKNKVCRPYAR